LGTSPVKADDLRKVIDDWQVSSDC
jgi:hypothetical protein